MWQPAWDERPRVPIWAFQLFEKSYQAGSWSKIQSCRSQAHEQKRKSDYNLFAYKSFQLKQERFWALSIFERRNEMHI